MQYVFYQATAFNVNIGAWNTASTTTMTGAFRSATAFNASIGTWNTARVTNMEGVFFGATAFNQNLGSWNTALVTTMASMFYNTAACNQNIGSWNTARVATMVNMFKSATAFNQNIASWNTASLTSMASVRPLLFSPHRLHVWRVGRALMSPAFLLPRRMAPRPCSHSLPVGALASMLWRTVRLLPHRHTHVVLCTAHPWCGVHGMRVLLPCSRLAAPDAATGRRWNLHGALACRRRVRP
jgi:surface protein